MCDLLPLIQDKLNIIFTWDKYKESKCKSIFLFLINYDKLTMSCCTGNIANKPADLDLCCFQLSLYLVSYCFLKSLCMVINKIRDKLGSLCIICSFGQVKFSLDKYIMAIYLSLATYKMFLIHTPDFMLKNVQLYLCCI